MTAEKIIQSEIKGRFGEVVLMNVLNASGVASGVISDCGRGVKHKSCGPELACLGLLSGPGAAVITFITR